MAAIHGELGTLGDQVSAAVANLPNGEVANTFIQNEIALTEFALDSLANELVAAGSTPEFAALDAALAQNMLRMDELNALFDIGALTSGSGGGGTTT